MIMGMLIKFMSMQKWQKKPKKSAVLVTGGGGFIGSHLVWALLKNGYRVFSVDNYAATGGVLLPERKHPHARYITCDIRDADKLTRTIARIQPSIKDPVTYCEVNSIGTLNVLLAAKSAKTKRVVYSASSSAYGKNKIPFSEAMKPDPLNPYAKTKLDGEQWMRIFAELYGIETVSLRYFNVYGKGNVYNGPYTTVITKFFHRLLHGKLMEIVGDGKQTRDYTNVADVVAANIRAALSTKVGRGEVINIGCGKCYSILTIAELIGGEPVKDLVKHKKAAFVAAWPGESRDTMADIKLAKHFLNWSPSISLPEGIRVLSGRG